MGLSWQNATEVAVVLTAVGSAGALAPPGRVRAVAAFVRELAVIAALYALWELAGRISVAGTGDALDRARWIERFDARLPLPSEHSVQHLVLGHRLIVEGANWYYAAMHLTTMGAFLFWLFVRHREHYRPVRMVMAWTTLGCLLIQLMPVAPPRMLPGFVDTGLLYHESVYSGGIAADQLSAMPSVHVAWAVCIGYYVWRISPSRWRVLGPAHAVLMSFVVVATGNHWWLDAIVSVAVLTCCAWAVAGGRAAWRRLRHGGEAPPDQRLGERPRSFAA